MDEQERFDLAPKVGKGDIMFCDFCEQNHEVQEDHPSSQYIMCKGKMQLVGIYGRMVGQ